VDSALSCVVDTPWNWVVVSAPIWSLETNERRGGQPPSCRPQSAHGLRGGERLDFVEVSAPI